MSNSIEASLRLEIAQYQQQLAKAKAEAQKFRDGLSSGGGISKVILGSDETWGRHKANMASFTREMNNLRGASRGIQLGGVAMQAQDIAVQLQMGTKASIVLAQQGSQILGAFGTGGAVLGGVLAIGGAFYTMAEKSKEAFEAMKADADSFGTRMKASLAGSSTEIAAFFAEVKGGVSSAYKEIEGLNSGASGIMARITALFGGPSVSDRETAANALAVQKANALASIQQALLDMSAKELRIAELKAGGQDKAAASLQRQLELQREIQRLQGMDLPDEVRARLAQDATAKSRLSGLEVTDPKAAQETAAKLRDLKTEAAGIAESMLPDAQRLAALKSKLEDVLAAARVRHTGTAINGVSDLAGLAAGAKHAAPVEEYKKALELQQQIKQLSDNMATQAQAKRKQEAEAIARQLEQMKTEQERTDKEQAAQNRAKNELAAEIRIDQLRAAGKENMAEIEERRLRIAREALQIQQATGYSEQQSLMLARQRDAMRAAMGMDGDGKRSTKARMFTEADRQAGWTHPSQRAGKARMMGGLDQHFRNQQTASDWEMLQRGAGQWQQLQQRGMAPVSALQTTNAAKQDAASAKASSTVNLGTKEIEIFMQMRDALNFLVG
jgi:hypothetical protein